MSAIRPATVARWASRFASALRLAAAAAANWASVSVFFKIVAIRSEPSAFAGAERAAAGEICAIAMTGSAKSEM